MGPNFLPADKYKRFPQRDSIFLAVRIQSFPKHQKKNIAISLQYLKEKGKNEVLFLPEEKRQRFAQIDTITLSICGKACLNQITQNNKFDIS